MRKLVVTSGLFVLCFIILSCSSQKRLDPKLKRDWKLIEFSNFNKQLLMQYNVGMDLAQKHTVVYAGCKTQQISFVVKSEKEVKIWVNPNPVESCSEEINGNLRLRLNGFLKGTKEYIVEGHFLTLYNSDGSKIKFVAADWD